MKTDRDLLTQLKIARDAVILAHYYVDAEVQKIADYVGDSYYLSQVANKIENRVVVFCGVQFMGESAKIMNPEKTILMPDEHADCPMAHMASIKEIKRIRSQYQDLAVVCYVNSTAELKAHSDVCVTSSNALRIVKALSQKNIYFIPDENLAHYIAAQLPEKNFIFNDGFCCVHHNIEPQDVKDVKNRFPQTLVLAHPECRADVLALADYIGSTKGIIEFAKRHSSLDFIICTEEGISYELKKNCPDKSFHFVQPTPVCKNMKRITLEKVIRCLQKMQPQILMEADLCTNALHSLKTMHEMAGQNECSNL